MTIVRWDPWRSMTTLQDRINRLFEELSAPHGEDDNVAISAWRPAVDIYDQEDSIVIKAELPGLNKDGLSIEIKENKLVLKGERLADKEIKEENYYRRERSFGSFHRAFSLPAGIDPDNVTASFKDGILKVEIPKAEETKPKRITID
jgi:HSP20 family protein